MSEHHLIDPLDRDPTQQIRVDLVRRCRFAGVWSLVDRHQSHQPHQALHPFAIHHVALVTTWPWVASHAAMRREPE